MSDFLPSYQDIYAISLFAYRYYASPKPHNHYRTLWPTIYYRDAPPRARTFLRYLKPYIYGSIDSHVAHINWIMTTRYFRDIGVCACIIRNHISSDGVIARFELIFVCSRTFVYRNVYKFSAYWFLTMSLRLECECSNIYLYVVLGVATGGTSIFRPLIRMGLVVNLPFRTCIRLWRLSTVNI